MCFCILSFYLNLMLILSEMPSKNTGGKKTKMHVKIECLCRCLIQGKGVDVYVCIYIYIHMYTYVHKYTHTYICV